MARHLVAFCLFWSAHGGWLAIALATTLRCFPAERYAEIDGLVCTAYGVGELVGTLITGQLRDWLCTYSAAFLPLTGLALLGIALSAILLPGPGETSRSRHRRTGLDQREQTESRSGQNTGESQIPRKWQIQLTKENSPSQQRLREHSLGCPGPDRPGGIVLGRMLRTDTTHAQANGSRYLTQPHSATGRLDATTPS